jgi:hypothetical protein
MSPCWGWTRGFQANRLTCKSLPAERMGSACNTQPVTWLVPGKTEPIEQTSHDALRRSRRTKGPQGSQRMQEVGFSRSCP